MSLLFSRQCEYALQAVTFLALKKEGEMTSIKELAGKLDIPHFFLAKILHDLTRKGLLTSLKGPTGGFALGLPPGKITLFQIVEAVDGIDFSVKCVMGLSKCSADNPCAMHDSWSATCSDLRAMLLRRTIAQFAADMRTLQYEFSG